MTSSFFIPLLLTGMAAGTAAGFLGVGGGFLLTPLCLAVYSYLGIEHGELFRVIFGTNMVLVTLFSISAVIRHRRHHALDPAALVVIGVPAVAGSFAGAWAASVVDPALLRQVFAGLLVFSSIMIMTGGAAKSAAGRASSAEDSPAGGLLPTAMLPLLGFVAGMVGSFIGVGGGIVMIPGLILLFGHPVNRVAVTSSSVIIFIGFAGAVSYMWHGHDAVLRLPGWRTGYVWWAAALPLALGGIPMAQVGAWLNARTHTTVMRRIFGVLLLSVAIKMLFF